MSYGRLGRSGTRFPQRSEYQERGQLRSGARFAARNLPYYSSLKELLSHHRRLFEKEPAISQRYFYIGGARSLLSGRSLMQTTVRYRVDYPDIKRHLTSVFHDLFREHTENTTDGFEVVITFNAILSNSERSSFSIFYGHDHRANNFSGAYSHLRHNQEPEQIIVRNLPDVDSVPTHFDFEQLAKTHRQAFADSGVSIYKFVSVVYLVYRFVKRQKQK